MLGKHSGRHAFRDRLQELGLEVEGEEFERAFKRFKDLADAKKTIFNEDLEAIVSDSVIPGQRPVSAGRAVDHQRHLRHAERHGRADLRGRALQEGDGAGRGAGRRGLQGDRRAHGDQERARALPGACDYRPAWTRWAKCRLP